MDISSYFVSASKFSVVSSSSDSEDVIILRLIYSLILLRSIAQVLLLNHCINQLQNVGESSKDYKIGRRLKL